MGEEPCGLDIEYYAMQSELSRLTDENAKLCELVRDVWDAALHPETFGDGSHLLRRMRDLGIEVKDES